MKKAMVILLVVSLFSMSCGTIMNGTTQEIRFSSNPRGATVVINGDDIGDTPLYYDLKRNNSYNVVIELDGYKPYETEISRRMSGWALGNIVFFLVPGIAVDAVTGGLFTLTPDDVHARMREGNVIRTDKNETLYITVVLKPEKHWKKIGQLEKVK